MDKKDLSEFLTKIKDLIEKNQEDTNRQIIELIKDKNIYELTYPSGENLLHWAAAFNNAFICEYLLKSKNVHVNIENYRGSTALYYAAFRDSIAALEILLKYHANPKIRSGFSGLFPIDAAKNRTMKDMLEHADNKLVPIDYITRKIKPNINRYTAYKYRYYMWWLSNLNYFNNPYKNTISGITIIPEAAMIHNTGGIIKLADQCQRIYDSYVNCLNTTILENKCLYCDKIDNLKICSTCRSAYFCSEECQKKAEILHKYDCS